MHAHPPTHPHRKRRLQGALAGFGIGGWLWHALFFAERLATLPRVVKAHFHPSTPPAHPFHLPRHEHP